MRTYFKVDYEASKRRPPADYATRTGRSLSAVRDLLSSSSWVPVASLSNDQLNDLIRLAQTAKVELAPMVPDERLERMTSAVELERWQESLASNVLDLLIQMHHGNVKLADVVAEMLLPLNDAHSGCWGLAIVDRDVVHFRLRSSDVTSLRAATENILAVLRVNQWVMETLPPRAGSESTDRGPGGLFRLRIGEHEETVIQSNRVGEEEAWGQVHVLSRLGLVWYSATRGAASVLWVLTALLAGGSLLAAFVLQDPAGQPWLAAWGHATLDRIFTGALGAALVASVTGAQLLQAARRPGGQRVLIRWR